MTPTHDKTARIYDRDGNQLAVLTEHTAEVWDARFTDDGSRVITASKDGTARLWDSAGRLLRVLEGHSDIPLVTCSPDGETLLTTLDDAKLQLWDKDGNPLALIKGRYAAFSPDGNHLVAMTNGNNAFTYRVPRLANTN